jgi:hypothetical protein
VSCLHYFACKEVAFSEQQSIDLFGKAFSGISCCSLEQINEATTMVVLDKVVSKAAVQKLIAPISNDSLLIIRKPHQTKKHFQLWQEVLSLEKVSLSIDTFSLGFIFFRTEQANQNFIIRA